MKKQVEFKIGKDILRGSLFIPDGKGSFPAVIFFHGSGATGETYFEAAEKLSKNGILGFAFNYRGCGMSDGKFEDQTVGMGIEDTKAAIKFFLSQKEVDKNRIGFAGASFGGFMASMFPNDFNSKSLMLIAPAAYNREIINKTHRDADDLNKFENSQSYPEISKFKGDLLVVKCEFDDVLPPEMVEKYLNSASSAKRKESYVLKGAKHRISINPKARKVLVGKIVEWFSKTL